jgi:hypothetical protein
MEEKFNSIVTKLPIGKDEDVWTYELFSGLSSAQMEHLIKELPRQTQCRYRNIFNENRPNKASKGYFSFILFKIFHFVLFPCNKLILSFINFFTVFFIALLYH